MKLTKMSGADLSAFFQGGCALLAAHKEEVNALNVFPVPDGDTGINMFLTVDSARKHIVNKPSRTVDEVAQNFSMGALMGARGNSGVILSQIFRGFSQSVKGKESLDAREFVTALQKGVDLSYKSVMKPVEGTILTVFRDLVAAANNQAHSTNDIGLILETALKAGQASLAKTPELLPVLKQAGVVDAGGKGLLFIIEGGFRTLLGEDMEKLERKAEGESLGIEAIAAEESAFVDQHPIRSEDIVYAYCTQVLIKGEKLPLDTIRTYLSTQIEGDSLLAVGTEDIIKIHFHTNHPGLVLEYAGQFGSLHDIEIDNMREQNQKLTKPNGKHNGHNNGNGNGNGKKPELVDDSYIEQMEEGETAVIAVCAGDGLSDIFKTMGAIVINGGQTMNPSAAEFVSMTNRSKAKEVVILPNNSNIILTAQQAKGLSEKPVHIIKTKYVTQGLVAMLPFDKDKPADWNVEAMEQAVGQVVSGEVTYAIRDSSVNGLDIKENDILALLEGEIAVTGKELLPTMLNLIHRMVDQVEDPCIISLIAGEEIEASERAEIEAAVKKEFSDLDVECSYGGQPLYYFFVSVE